jgi:Na+/H+-dicarboxylate symporter
MSASGRLARIQRLSMSPWTVLACVAIGIACGILWPGPSRGLSVIGEAYVDLLKMIVLPFMVSSVIFSVQVLFREGGAGRILARVVFVFMAASAASALIPAGLLSAYNPATHLTEAGRASLGGIVGSEADRSNTTMTVNAVDEPPKQVTLRDVLASIIPSNIFASLANGEALKALIFALLFGSAAGKVPTRISEAMTSSLETIYRTCQTLTRWVNIPVPIVLICLSASQIAETGVQPMIAMARFVLAFGVLCTVMMALAVMVLRYRSGRSLAEVLASLREPFAVGVATNNSATCMPAMMDTLADRLGFSRARVELLVPLTVSMFRAGAIAYFVCATLFVAGLYERPIGMQDLFMVALVSAIAGFASSGMAGIVTVTLVGTVCSYLSVPFEAAFILFAAVDPICAMARTATTVIAGCAAIATICPEPLRL